jgi:hypothetical protein
MRPTVDAADLALARDVLPRWRLRELTRLPDEARDRPPGRDVAAQSVELRAAPSPRLGMQTTTGVQPQDLA